MGRQRLTPLNHRKYRPRAQHPGTERAKLPVRAFLSIGVLTLLLIHPPKASAQEPVPVDPIDSMPFRFGPVGVSPTLTITNFGIDTNVFNDPNNPERDFTLTATPKVQARLRSGKVLLSGSLATGMNYYQKFSEERSVDYSADGRGDLDFGWFKPYAFMSRLDTHERLNAELDLRAPRVQNDVGVGARFESSPRTTLVVDGRHSKLTFDEAAVFDGVPLSSTLNSTTDVFEGGIEWKLTPLTTFSVLASHQQDRFEQSPDRDSNSFRILPTIRMEAPAIVQGTFAIGYRRFNGVDPTLPDYSGVVMKGTVGHTIAERTRVELQLSRDVQYSFEVVEPYYLTTGIRATLTQQLQEAMDVRVSVGRERLDYRAGSSAVSSSRVDRADVASVGVGYRVNPNLRVGVDLEFARRVSDRADRDYDRTRLVGSVAYGF